MGARRLALAAGAGLVCAAAGAAIWVGVTITSGRYRAFLAILAAAGAAIGVRLVVPRGGRPAQALGLAAAGVAIVGGQYLAVSALFRDLAARSGRATLTGPLVPVDLFLAAWAELRDPGREAVFAVVSAVLVLWLLRARPRQDPED